MRALLTIAYDRDGLAGFMTYGARRSSDPSRSAKIAKALNFDERFGPIFPTSFRLRSDGTTHLTMLREGGRARLFVDRDGQAVISDSIADAIRSWERIWGRDAIAAHARRSIEHSRGVALRVRERAGAER